LSKTGASKKVLVTGATGAIGKPLTEYLMQQGYTVRILVRNPVQHNLPDQLDICCGDIGTGQGIEEAVRNVDIVFHLAAKLHIVDPAAELESEYERINIEGTRRLVYSATKAKVNRFVFFSTISVYGHTRKGQICDENTRLNPENIYAQTKVQAEKIVKEFPKSVILRLGAVYGPNMKGNYPRLLQALKLGLFFFVGDASNRRTLVHIEDVCRAALLAAEHPMSAGNIYNVSDGKIHKMRDIIAAMSKALGRNAPRMQLPVPVVRFFLWMVEIAFRMVARKPPVNHSTVDKLIEDIAVCSDRIQKELGFVPHWGLDKGWSQCIKESV
jgi:UDP-glucose 4-epimerase